MSQAQAAISPSLRPQLKRILLTTDFSSCSAAAASVVRTLANSFGATVVVTHIVPAEPRFPVPLEHLPRELDLARAAAEKQMEQFLVTSNLKGLPVEVLIERGDIEQIVTAALQEQNIDLVAVGTHGRGSIGKFVLGSVAERIFRTATCPVLTVGPEAHAAWENVEVVASRGGERKLNAILFATDFSPGSLHALPYAIALAGASNAELLLLHAVEPVGVSPLRYEEVNDCHQRLGGLISAEAKEWCKYDTFVVPGPAADVILETAQERNADLIVMGAHPVATSFTAVHVPRTTAYRVAAHGHCPVLTVRS